ncbi:MAG: hypothetical protein RML45_04695 [Acetobacteraceae bacterium]|nr:hypothetical protein [Acetobacteraceae bacterium]
MFGGKTDRGCDRGQEFIRRFVVTDAAQHDGAELAAVLDPTRIGGAVLAEARRSSRGHAAY